MALSFSSCSSNPDMCKIRVVGKKVRMYDSNGELSLEKECNFEPTKAYWTEGPNGGMVIAVENGSPQNGCYFSNQGEGVLPIISYSQQRVQAEIVDESSQSSQSIGTSIGGAIATGAGNLLAKGVAKGVQAAQNAHAKKVKKQAEQEDAQQQFILKLYTSGFIKEYLNSVKQAERKAKQIEKMGMPKSPQEFFDMLDECKKKLTEDIEEDEVLKTELEKLGSQEEIENMNECEAYIDSKGNVFFNDDDDEEREVLCIDLTLPAQTIHEGWQKRFDLLIKYAKKNFSRDETVKQILKDNKFNTSAGQTIKTILIFMGVILISVLLIWFCML